MQLFSTRCIKMASTAMTLLELEQACALRRGEHSASQDNCACSGKWDGDEEARLRILSTAAQAGAPFIDVELESVERFFEFGNWQTSRCTRLILSHHNFERTLPKAELEKVVARMRGAGADIAKVAMMAEDITDAWTMLDLLRNQSGPMISISMGERGVISRVLASKYGSFLTFAAIAPGAESAPGQPTVDQLKTLYRLSNQNPDTKVYGIIGNPVGHSKSPLLHNTAMAEADFDGVYVPLLVDDMNKFLSTFFEQDWQGFSVTIPHKSQEALVQGAACELSCPDQVAAKIGAVNTLLRQPDGSLVGCNTDWDAAITAVQRAMAGENGDIASAIVGKSAVILGTGGAARALLFGAVERGAATIIVAGRSKSKAQELAKQVAKQTKSTNIAVSACTLDDVEACQLERIDIVLNTTPLGMVGSRVDQTPLSKTVLAKYRPLVFDAVYTPLETRLIKEAKECDCQVVNGLEMFVGQAAMQFEMFTGLEAPVELMKTLILRSE